MEQYPVVRVSKDHSPHKDDHVQMASNLTVMLWAHMLITAVYRDSTACKNSFKQVADGNVCLLALLNPVILKSRILLVTGVHCLSSRLQLSAYLHVRAPATKIPEQKETCLN